MIDLNDFDEAHPGCWEWDLRRLVGQRLGGRTGERRDRGRSATTAVLACVAAYRDEVRFLAEQPLLMRIVQPAGRRPAARDGDREVAAGRDRAIGQAGPDPDQRPGAAAVHGRARRGAAHRRGTAADHPGAGRTRRAAIAAALDELPAHPGAALAAGGRRLHPGRHRAQGGRGGQRGAARLRGAARGQQRRRCAVPAAQAGPPLGAGPVRARRLGLARPPGPAGGGVPAGAADGQRPAAGLDQRRRAGTTTCASSAT